MFKSFRFRLVICQCCFSELPFSSSFFTEVSCFECFLFRVVIVQFVPLQNSHVPECFFLDVSFLELSCLIIRCSLFRDVLFENFCLRLFLSRFSVFRSFLLRIARGSVSVVRLFMVYTYRSLCIQIVMHIFTYVYILWLVLCFKVAMLGCPQVWVGYAGSVVGAPVICVTSEMAVTSAVGGAAVVVAVGSGDT